MRLQRQCIPKTLIRNPLVNGTFLLAIKEGCENVQSYPQEFLMPAKQPFLQTVPRTQLSLSQSKVHSEHSKKATKKSLLLNRHIQAGASQSLRVTFTNHTKNKDLIFTIYALKLYFIYIINTTSYNTEQLFFFQSLTDTLLKLLP